MAVLQVAQPRPDGKNPTERCLHRQRCDHAAAKWWESVRVEGINKMKAAEEAAFILALRGV